MIVIFTLDIKITNREFNARNKIVPRVFNFVMIVMKLTLVRRRYFNNRGGKISGK
ncbi:MAG: hypothetical protein K8H86_14720 [Ignavibacteriaceae bacterium]|nr:hypothetical protein [Ignavibacteriaceae bacterium]